MAWMLNGPTTPPNATSISYGVVRRQLARFSVQTRDHHQKCHQTVKHSIPKVRTDLTFWISAVTRRRPSDLAPIWPSASKAPALVTSRMSVRTTFSLCFLITAAINSCHIMALCENRLSPVSL